jgi:hypothetical protein
MGFKKKKKKPRKETKSKQARGYARGTDDSGKPDQMPVDHEKLSNATDVMGMVRGKGVMSDTRRRQTPKGRLPR